MGDNYMEYDFSNDVKLYMIFDILGDIVRTGPLLWKIDRKRTEDVKDHILDLLFIVRVLKKYLPDNIDYNKINDYIICHDLPEAITGDITKFEGVSEEEIKRVTKIAINYLSDKFNDVMDFNTIINNYENRVDIETKIVHMIDKVHSAIAFIKYQCEYNIDMNNPEIIPELRNHPFVAEKINEGRDIADIFFEFHMKAVNITDSECEKYNISRENADKIVDVISVFAREIYSQKLNGILLKVRDNFPLNAMKYNRKI